MLDAPATGSGSGSQQGETYIQLKIDPDPGMEFRFSAMTATEELGRPFLIALDITGEKVKTDLSKMLGSSVTVTMTDAKKDKRYFNGILTRIEFVGVVSGIYRYKAELRPWIWLLTRKYDCKIFQNKAPWDIINDVFKKEEFTALKDMRRREVLAGSKPLLEFSVQYRESCYDFVTRLMEEYGLYYYFEHSDSEHKLVFADDPNSHSAISKAIPNYFGQLDQRAVQDHIWEWNSDGNLQSGMVTCQDYNFHTPSTDLTSKTTKPGDHKYGSFEIYQYPGYYLNTDDGKGLTDVKMQSLTARVEQFRGKTNSREMRCGMKFTLSKFVADPWNKEYLITRAVTTLTAAEGAADTRGNLIDSHRVEFNAILGTTPYRLQQITPRPMIRGPQTALVVGDQGEEVTTNKDGQIKVQFYWDRDGKRNQDSSCWIRVAHSWAGSGWGSIVLPRQGMEVVVEFLEGNPDRPLVTGVVYNATQTVPNTLPDKKVLSTFKTSSSKGGGGYNEFTFDDTKGSELVTFQAQKDYHKTVLNSETVDITQDTTTTVKQGNRSVTVSQGNDSLTVSTGNLSISVSAGSTSITSGQSITLTVGANSITINASGITISGSQITVSGDGPVTVTGQPISLN